MNATYTRLTVRFAASVRSMAVVLVALATLARPTVSATDRPGFATLRYDEDWSFLSEPDRRTHLFDAIKFIRLWESGESFLSLGGEARLKYERYDRAIFNQRPEDDSGFLLQRYLLHGDLHATPWFRAFGQLQSSLVDFRAGGARPTDRDRLDLHQAFADVVVLWNDTQSTTLRVGRQEMAYGSQRLVSVRESPNNRLAFDAVRLLATFGAWKVDAWISQPVEVDPGLFDDQRIDGTDFWGAYATGPVPWIKGLKADVYYLGLARDAARFARGTHDELRHSLGSRLHGKRGGLDWNFEFVGQFGSFGDDDILAWTAASDTGWTFAGALGKPRIFLRADIASGDDGQGALGTFNPLFPRGSYFNEASLVGPQNLMDLQPGVEVEPVKGLRLTASCDVVWRESVQDGVYGTALNLQLPPGTSQARFVGTFPSVSVHWQATPHLGLRIDYVACIVGAFVTETAPTQRSANYLSATATYRF